MNCVFCDILAGRIPAHFVYRDNSVFAILSLEQPNPYKILVIPNAHVETIYDLSDELAAKIFQVVVKLTRAVRDISGCEGLNLVQSNGKAGQQDVFHFHLHIVPRYMDDSITLHWDNTPESQERLAQLASELQVGLS